MDNEGIRTRAQAVEIISGGGASCCMGLYCPRGVTWVRVLETPALVVDVPFCEVHNTPAWAKSMREWLTSGKITLTGAAD